MTKITMLSQRYA